MRNAARVFAAIKDADLLKLPFRRVPFGRRLWNARSTPTERSGGSSLVGGLAAPRPAHYPTPLAGPSFVRASARARRRSGKPRHSFESYVNVMGFGVCGCLWATAYHLPASKSAMSSEDELSSLSAELNGVSGEVQATQEELNQLRAVQERATFRRATTAFLRSNYSRITYERILEECGPCPVRKLDCKTLQK